MDKELFVQNVKFYCQQKNVKPTVACREAGVGTSFINNIEARGQIPSVEKVQLLAQYLGVTVSELIGEVKMTPLEYLKYTSGDRKEDLPKLSAEELVELKMRVHLSREERALLDAFRNADEHTKKVVGLLLEPFKEKETTGRTG